MVGNRDCGTDATTQPLIAAISIGIKFVVEVYDRSSELGVRTLQFTLSFIKIFVADIIYAAPVLITLVVLIIILGLAIARFEGWTTIDGLYHAFINATTVGYGDFRPTNTAAKIISIALAMVGLIFTGLIVAIAVHSANIAFTGLSVPGNA